MNNFNLIERYCYPEITQIWTNEYKYKKWLEVELAILEAQEKLGIIKEKGIAQKIRKVAQINPPRIDEIEKETQHDVIAFVKSIAEQSPLAAKYLHFGVTSYDIVDTSLSLLMCESTDIIIADIKELIETIKHKAKEHKYTLMIGRTHGIHAEPITFGLKLCVWLYELQCNLIRLIQAKKDISYCKISGAVGNYSTNPPEVEELVAKKLKLKPAKVSTQILQRDRHSYLLLTLSIIAGSIEKFATEVRNLQRTEINELQEPFKEGQRGSSAMPHKKNPIISERICSLARVIKSNAIASLENIVLWHERDLTNSAAERIIIPQTFILLDYILRQFKNVIEGLIVNKENMLKNLNKTKGVISSGKTMSLLIDKGLTRDEAYDIVQKASFESFNKEKDFKSILLKDKKVVKYIKEEELDNCMNYNDYLKHIDKIFKRFNI